MNLRLATQEAPSSLLLTPSLLTATQIYEDHSDIILHMQQSSQIIAHHGNTWSEYHFNNLQ